jgi:hypothetical protein
LSQSSSTKTWVTGALACLAGILLSLRCSTTAQSPSHAASQPPRGAYRPELRRVHVPDPVRSPPTGAVHGDRNDDELSPELQQRLRAAMTIMTVPAAIPTGQTRPPLPTGPVSPEAQAQRQMALHAWKAEVQRHVDDCVARPAPLRQPVALAVIFAPLLGDAEYVPQQLSPAVVSVPVQELRRLWRDTDPDALQECVDRIRMMTLAVPTARNAPAQALPGAVETVLIDV